VEAADGHLARVRLPGGLVMAGQLRALARLAAELGDGRAELTSRGNVQLRALPAGAAGQLTAELAAAGLLPSLDHDRVRNILASPLAGLDNGIELTPLVAALDAGLCARPRLAQLSGRFLFAVDDGRGDVAGLGADIVAAVRPDATSVNGLAVASPATGPASPATAAPVTGPASPATGPATATPVTGPATPATAATARALLTSSSRPSSGVRDSLAFIPAVMLAFAEAFLDDRAAHGSTAWRIAGLPGGADRIRAAVAHRLALAPAGSIPSAAATSAPAVARPVGVIGRHAVLLAPLGRLTSAQLDWLADQVRGRPARITPWRSVVLPDLADPEATLRAAAGLGFGVDAESPWLRVTACAGQPGCASALADVQADAASFASRWPGRIVHVSGCARHCGRPAATEIDVTATSEGYQVAGV
jgi:precorrin-3B synthase